MIFPKAQKLGPIDESFVSSAAWFINWVSDTTDWNDIDICVIDACGPRNEWFFFCKWLNRNHPQVPSLIVLDLTSAVRYNSNLHRANFQGLILKTASDETMEFAIKDVARGKDFLDTDLKTVYPKVRVQDFAGAPRKHREVLVDGLEDRAQIELASHRLMRSWFPPKTITSCSVTLEFTLASNGMPTQAHPSNHLATSSSTEPQLKQ